MEFDMNAPAKMAAESPSSAELEQEEFEEIVRQTKEEALRPSKGPVSFPRCRRSVIRRRRPMDERGARGGNGAKSYHVATFGTRRSVDGSEASLSSNLTVVTAATSSSPTDRWSNSSGFVEDVGDDNRIEDKDRGEDVDDDGELLVPKIEPIDDDDIDMAMMNESATPDTASTSTSPRSAFHPTKRPRGRPRKHPKVDPDSIMKVAKGRSKTGCITCRKRKKKCDEGKPGCMNCEKNSVTCEGYLPKTLWKSGKDKAEEARMRRDGVLPKIKLEPIIPGVDTAGDKLFFEHYIFRLSGILTVEREENHAFKDMMLQLAVKHIGLMHSILALSSKHIDFRSDYGIQFIQEHPDLDVETLENRYQFHRERAMAELNSDIERLNSESATENVAVNPAIYGQMVCLVLETLADPNPTGQHRVHLEAYSKLVLQYPPEDRDFLCFIEEFFQYHISADELICLPEGRVQLGAVSEDLHFQSAIAAPDSTRLLGVFDGLFQYMSKITNLRNKIRENVREGIDPAVDYTVLYRVAAVDAGIRGWTPAWPEEDARYLVGLLYKQMMWIYLRRTIHPPQTNSWKPDKDLVEAVDAGIELLAQLQPNDPVQTLVLAPAFVIGCAAFEDRQREPIRQAIGVVKDYRHYKNSDSALEVLEEVWRLMDAKSQDSWDWQMIAHRMGLDFLAT